MLAGEGDHLPILQMDDAPVGSDDALLAIEVPALREALTLDEPRGSAIANVIVVPGIFADALGHAATFRGEQLHTVDYPGPEHFRGRRVLVVGGGASAVQFLGELAPIADTLWVTRREPVWNQHGFDGRAAVARVLDRVRAGKGPASVVSVTGLALRPQERLAESLGAYRRRPMFERIEPDGVRWMDGSFEAVDVILWATGFRPAVDHLAPLHLRTPYGGIALLPGGADVQSAVTAAADPRVQLVGYGPSASTIGATRAGRAAALAVRRYVAADGTADGVAG